MNADIQKIRDKIAGALYGLLVGDAFGCPMEGWPPSKIRAVYGTLEDKDQHCPNLGPGSVDATLNSLPWPLS